MSVASVPSMQPIMIAIAVCVVVAMLAWSRSGGGGRFRASDYRPKPLLSAWERAALAELRAELPPHLYACPQVRLADMLHVASGPDRSRNRAALSRTASKSVDFAVIDASGSVVLVIELDDKTHARPDRQQRDAMIDVILRECGIPIRRVKPFQRLNASAFLPAAGLISRNSRGPRAVPV